ncbi:hypothetical protein [Catellatospora bangladeshensis]|uniref:Uncharacterized protein n=1 Tax=Catellatospora bangladeshensis TaxID=310355 RepID=A0A8J3J901_9ACTN|nr:hypothetical protein [Catellatospora bangladeshensis]GIF80462.1 hypothetical protein Cba03nite_18110 [Catellatospora bangladeshensis]
MTGQPPLHEAVAALAGRPAPDRRRVAPDAVQPFRATMRNDFLTPRGTPYKWQDVTASLTRTLTGGSVGSLVPVRYQWDRVDAGTGSPDGEGEQREWTFARGQSFTSVLMHTDVAGVDRPQDPPPGTPLSPMDISYPGLPKAPAVDLLLMLSWDVVTFEMLCTHLTTTPALRTPGSWAELDGISGSWAELRFSDPGATAVFRNAHATARHLGHGTYGGRPSVVYSMACLDCVLDVRSGPVRQRGRSSYWITLQADAETGDLLFAEMTEMIVATVTGADGQRVPVQKRRTVRMFAGTQLPAPTAAAIAPARPEPEPAPRPTADGAQLAEALRLTGRVADHLTWQVSSLAHLPQGMADLTLMGFRSVVGADLPGTYRQVKALQAGLRAAADGDGAVWSRLPEYRRSLEGLLAFGQFAADGADRLLAGDQPGRDIMTDHIRVVRVDLTDLLALLDRLAQPVPVPSATGHESEAQP